ncbi:AI-2E family transporter [Anaerococcus murdochii]|uniref:AI-2E family transporter n=1 Tax=Anaerococcus murdochii TaxID=411577 RepID=A0ABS7SZ70_9FIRM|nr:AI-2E family transporter [Anaerococcus murdochii]MBZ2386852.1 AI-2E family transporter [Anaerococcus murdochii]
MRKLDEKSQNLLKVVVLGILLYFGFYYIESVSKAFSKLYLVLQPFILGGALAFIISIPMNFFERQFSKLDKNDKHKKLITVLALLISWIIVFLAFTILITILVPSIAKVVNTFINKWPEFVDDIYKMLQKYPITEPYADKFMDTLSGISWDNIKDASLDFLKGNEGDVLSKATSLVSSVSSGVIGVFTMFVFSIFILLSKRMLKINSTRILYAVMSEERADYINKVFSLSYNTFKDYIFSRLISVICLSVLTFIGMFVMRIPNAVMISLIVGFSDLIPIFGPIVGTAFSMILIFIESPFKALVFLIYNLVIQQIQENAIYPAIAGNKIGLPAVWVMASVTIGGSLFGVWGMLVSIPVVSVIYSLSHEKIHHMLEEKGFDEEKLLAKGDKIYKIEDIETNDEAYEE